MKRSWSYLRLSVRLLSGASVVVTAPLMRAPLAAQPAATQPPAAQGQQTQTQTAVAALTVPTEVQPLASVAVKV